MNSVFKLLIAAVVFGVLIYVIIGLFPSQKSNPYSNISSTITNAIIAPGEPICSEFSLNKNQSITTTTLLQADQLSNLKLYIWFVSTDPQYTVFNSDSFSSFIPKSNIAKLNVCTICYPSIIFSKTTKISNIISSKNLFCEVVFGNKLNPLQYDFDLVNKTEDQGFKNISISKMPDGYSLSYFVINNEKNESVENDSLAYLKYSQDKQLESLNIFSNSDIGKENQIEFSKAGEKIVLQALLPGNLDQSQGIILPAKFLVNSINVLPNDAYQSKTCVPTTTEKQYIDMDRQMCVVYNYCEGCVLAEHCSDAWNNSGIITEPVSSKFAKSHTTLDDTCP